MQTDWVQEIIELGREIKLVGIVLPMDRRDTFVTSFDLV